VLQLPCDGPALLNNVQRVLDSLASYAEVDSALIVTCALNIIGNNTHLLIFAVMLHLAIGRNFLAEKALRSASKSLLQRCILLSFSQDSIMYLRQSRSHASTQFVRREVARLSWQLESCLWIQRGGILSLSSVARKEATSAVRIGLMIASWNRNFECLRALIETRPDCHVDDLCGRHMWSSLEVAASTQRDVPSRSSAGGGWQFLVDCKRSQATEMLRYRPTGCFIIRPHSRDPGVFTLSFKTNLVPTNDLNMDADDRTPETSGDEQSDIEASKPIVRPATRPVKSSDVVQHAIVRLSESGFRCGSFGPFTSLNSLLEAVSSSLPFKLRFDRPPSSKLFQEDGSQTSPNAVLLRKLALRHASSITSNAPISVLPTAYPTQDGGIVATLNGNLHPHKTFSRERRCAFAQFLEMLILSSVRRQLCGVVATYEDDIQVDYDDLDEERNEMTEDISQGSDSMSHGRQILEASRILRPFLTWCRSMEVRTVSELAPELEDMTSSLPPSAVDVTESADAIEVAALQDQGGTSNGGDATLRRLIQQGSGVEFTTLRLVNGGECTLVLLFSRKDAASWLVANGWDENETCAEIRLQQMQVERFIEPVDLSRLPLKQKGSSLHDGEVRFRFVDPWEVEALFNRDGETLSASLGRSRLRSFSLIKVAFASDFILRSMGGEPLLELWAAMKGSITLTKALASVLPPWERAAGGDLIDSSDSSAESSPYLNSIRQNLYRAALYRRLDLPPRFVSLIQVELLDLKNLTSPGGSLSLNVYALLRLKRGASSAPLTNKSRTLDSAATQPVKLSKSSGPNAPASWGSVVRFRFPLPEDVSVDGASPDKDREILFRGPPSFLQVSVYEKKLLVDHSLGAADVSMDGLWAGGQLEEWVPLRSEKHGITWFARIRLTLRFELMCGTTLGGSDTQDPPPSVGLRRIEELSRVGGAAHDDLDKRSISSPDLLGYFESMVY
jgi:hypothetical protein